MSRAPTRSDFAVLGLRPGAGDDEIRDAYRRLAKIHHPDRNPGDAQALATFRRLTDSYAALKTGPRRGAQAPRTPLSAAVRMRTSSRRDAAAAATTLAELAVGDAAWVPPDAVLVGPDRAAALRPGTAGSAFPTAQHVIRVERRGDGHHVFMPPQPAARWPISEIAESEGLRVAKLWVGERQGDEAGHAASARMPLRLMTGTLAEMAVDARGWVAAEALAVDGEGAWSLTLSEPVSRHPHRATPVRVLRDPDGFRVQIQLPPAAWPPTQTGAGLGRAPVLSVASADEPGSDPPPAH
ncbi:MAG: J domain-containing protein [Candidatus Dormibacteraeota bacterium]|nr:J domain-containing protein [Candidatus Dormibacteraeota bacterium]